VLERSGRRVDAVIFLDVTEDVVFERLSKRRICEACGALYNLESDPPKVEGKCDKCGERLVKRSDDTEETVHKRLQVYRDQTLAVIAYYDSKGLLKKIDGNKSIGEVLDQILGVLDGLGGTDTDRGCN